MAKAKYRYNPKTLEYEKISLSTKDYMLRGLLYVLPLLILSGFFGWLIANSIDSPGELAAKDENRFLKSQLSEIKTELKDLRSFAQDIQEKDDNLYRNIFEAEPYPEHKRNLAIGGINRYEDIEGYDISEEIIETKELLSRVTRSLVSQSKSFEEVFDLVKNQEDFLAHIPAIQPVSNKDLTRMASGFGMRIHPIYRVPKMHWGMDFTASTGTEIYATGDGVVRAADNKYSGYGNRVEIDHGYGYVSLYGHMSRMKVRPGQKVKRGQVIGYVGSTGASTAPHCHYEVMKDGEKVNPAHYYFNDLTPEEYNLLLEKAAQKGKSLD
ncbi:MAG: M23 family metallopeptidase [Flavobacteriales bacterium]